MGKWHVSINWTRKLHTIWHYFNPNVHHALVAWLAWLRSSPLQKTTVAIPWLFYNFLNKVFSYQKCMSLQIMPRCQHSLLISYFLRQRVLRRCLRLLFGDFLGREDESASGGGRRKLQLRMHHHHHEHDHHRHLHHLRDGREEVETQETLMPSWIWRACALWKNSIMKTDWPTNGCTHLLKMQERV